MVAAVDRDDRSDRDARRLHVDQQERDPLLPLLRLRIGAHQTEAPIGVVRGRGPDLLAVDDVVVPVALGGGLERGEVRPGARLGEPLAPPIVDIGGARQKPLLLLLGAELDQHRPDHRDVERRHFGGWRLLVFFKEDHALYRCPTGAAMLLRPAVGGPIAPVQDALPSDGVVLGRRVAEPHPLADVTRQAIAEKGAQLVAKRQFIGREAQIHRSSSFVIE